MPQLKRDIEIKEAFANAANLDWLDRANAGPAFDSYRLREITVVRKDADALYRRLAREARYPGPPGNRRGDLLLAEVVEFCPVPFPVWQERAQRVLEQHAARWREQLRPLRARFAAVSVYSIPFAVFLLAAGSRPSSPAK